ncbi:PREDICTED: putative nuclease HARBI1 [Prunus dulcis]|uniref:PREDICTED: putative nuclease HARBI1 n=1 Tax=Prunus dulcis TaxID=3755 RepID=A0A5E4FLZ9_PRUDU|nr:PREDICTED: putative nuclease HARBI1 [Prunus dulcis]
MIRAVPGEVEAATENQQERLQVKKGRRLRRQRRIGGRGRDRKSRKANMRRIEDCEPLEHGYRTSMGHGYQENDAPCCEYDNKLEWRPSLDLVLGGGGMRERHRGCWKYDATGILGLLPEQKLTASLWMLAFGASADQVDEIARMGKSTILESLVRFCNAIKTLYTRDYLCKPTPRDLQRLLQKVEA